MIIRSQDKKMILNFNCIDTLRVKSFRLEKNENLIKYQILYYGVGEYDGFLANYSTEEKAIKVLDMIQEAYCGMRSVDCTTRGMLDTFAKREDVSCLLDLHIDKYFFQMPQDSEV